MAYIVELEPGETVLLDLDFQVSQSAKSGMTVVSPALAAEAKKQRLRIAISDRAFYLPATRFVVSGDPTYFRRLPKEQVQEVRVERSRPYGLWVVAALMIAAGLVMGVAMMLPLVTQTPGTHTVSGAPFAILVGGLLLPLMARGRQRLMVRLHKGCFGWNAPLVIDRASKQRITATLDDILKACRQGGYQVVDDRCSAEPQAYRTA